MPRRAVPLALAGLSLLLALLQRPGDLIADTKVHLYVDPSRFLGDVASAWSPTQDLGHVWAGQYGGYLWPMAPWFTAGDASGLPAWLVHRLWLAALFTVAAIGVVRLLDELWSRERGLAHLAAGGLYVLNPYVAVYVNRTSVALLAYAALPWLLLAVHRGVRAPRSWVWPAVFALAFTCTGGGVNVAVTAWLLLGPLLLLAYERYLAPVDLWPFLWRLGLATGAASAWWVVPVLVHAAAGIDFLPFTESIGTIWSTSSLQESLRLSGFWTSYIGVGYGGDLKPFAGHGAPLLFHPAVVAAGLLVPALALAGFAWTRQWRYGPFFLGLALLGLVVMTAGWPEGTPLRRGLTFTYNHVQPLQFLRTTYKAGPLVALGIACLGGVALTYVPRLRALAAAGALGLAALAAWPLTTGRAPERQLKFEIPKPYEALAADLDRRGDGSRTLLVPGQLFAFQEWGGTIDDVLPVLTERPVATRYIVPFADLRSVDLQWTVDQLLAQERLLPGQLGPLLDLMGIGDVVVAGDRDRNRGGGPGAAEVAQQLAGQAGFGSEGSLAYGPRRRVAPAAGRIAPPVELPQLRDVETPTGGIVRVLPRGPVTVVDGAGATVASLAAFDELDPARPLRYAADLSPRALRAAAAAGGHIVIGDSNRRRAFVASRLRGNLGETLTSDRDISEDGTMLDPFDRGPDAQTIAVVDGVAKLSMPFSPQVTQFPEHRPFAAFDGDERTAWLADRFLAPARHHLDVEFEGPRDVERVRLLPYNDSRARLTKVRVNGQTFNVRPGWNTLRVGLKAVRSLSVEIAAVERSKEASAGVGGLRELQIPGVKVTETLRPPVVAEEALRGTPLERARLSYLFERTTADSPWRRSKVAGSLQAGLLRDARDPEAALARSFSPPAARTWRAQAWASPSPEAADDVLDRLAGVRGKLRVTSSGRYEGLPRHRGSGAFDGGSRAWIGDWVAGRPAWIETTLPRGLSLRTLRLEPPGVRVRFPTRVRVNGQEAQVVGGQVSLARPVRGRLRIDVLDARFPRGTPGRVRQRRAVGIGEVVARGLPRLTVPRRGRVQLPCGAARATAGEKELEFRATASLSSFDAGRPLRAESCRRLALPSQRVELRGDPKAVLRLDVLRLSSAPLTIVAPGLGGAVADQGDGANGRRDGVRVRVDGPSWLVLGESYNAGWRATCSGRDLGAPVPLQGYANGWRIGPGCRDAAFTFAPNKALLPAYLLSLLACLALLALLLRNRHATRGRSSPLQTQRSAPTPRCTARQAMAWGVVAALAGGFVFALRAGLVIGPAVALVLWRGVSPARLSVAAGGLIAIAAFVHVVVIDQDDRGGYNTYYAVDHRAAHWIVVAAFVALAVALALTLSGARDRGADGPGSAPSAPGS